MSDNTAQVWCRSVRGLGGGGCYPNYYKHRVDFIVYVVLYVRLCSSLPGYIRLLTKGGESAVALEMAAALVS